MLNRASILARVAPFRGAIMAALGLPYVVRNDEMIGRSIRNRPGSDGRTALSVRASRSVLVADDRHRRFRAPSRAAADAFHAAGLATGGRCDGPRPDGNRAEAVRHHA